MYSLCLTVYTLKHLLLILSCRILQGLNGKSQNCQLHPDNQNCQMPKYDGDRKIVADPEFPQKITNNCPSTSTVLSCYKNVKTEMVIFEMIKHYWFL
jgi:hypothetical protein